MSALEGDQRWNALKSRSKSTNTWPPITLNRPDALNSFNDAMAAEITWAWETIRDTDDIHVAVLQANGDRAFCSGIDLNGGATGS